MIQAFDPGPVEEPFATLAGNYPGPETYPSEQFRVEWGPIFHRGRLDSSAHILVLGQDPGQHESIARRCLVGEAGQRVQGFLAKLGMERNYVMVNTFLYSVYGQPREKDVDKLLARTAPYRKRWLDALLLDTGIEAVVALGHLADKAFQQWRDHAPASAAGLAYEHVTHPTQPDSASKGDAAKRAAAMKRMLAGWNEALEKLAQRITHPDVERPLEPYGDDLHPADLAPIPAGDMPAGLPDWMRSLEQWAERRGDTPELKRATVVVTVPPAARP